MFYSAIKTEADLRIGADTPAIESARFLILGMSKQNRVLL